VRSKSKICMIGNGTMLKSCIQIAEQCPSVDLALVLLRKQEDGWHRLIETFCRKNSIACRPYAGLNDSMVEAAISDCAPELLISVHNPDILPEKVIKSAGLAINYHPAPLPRYAGLNAFSWALMNGEPRYGVTWHVLASRIDAGDIVAQVTFPIESDWTVMQLIERSAQEGCNVFREILPRLAAGSRDFVPQNLAQRTYYSGTMKPFDGNFPFSAPLPTLLNLNRATSFFPAINTFCMPKITVNEICFELVRFGLQSSPTSFPVGSIVDISEGSLVFAVNSGTMSTDLIRTAAGAELGAAEFAISMGLSIGTRAEISEQEHATDGLSVRA
jgi:methionyl-tRNA formyltransferase